MVNKNGQQKRGLENKYFAKFLSFLTKIAAKFWLLELKIAIFSENIWFWRKNVTFFFEMRVLWTELHLNWGSRERQEMREKGVLRAAHPRTPFSGECSPGRVPRFKVEPNMVHPTDMKHVVKVALSFNIKVTKSNMVCGLSGCFGTEYRSVTPSNFRFCISAFSWPYFSTWKTLAHQILHGSVYGGLRYDRMVT